MAGASLVYSNARVKAMENSLLSHDKITRICHSKDIDEAVRVLYEGGYAGGLMVDNPYSYEQILHAEYQIITTFIREAMLGKSPLKTLLMVNDYHNAKAVYKAKCMRIKDASYMIMPNGNIAVETIEYAITEGIYHSLPQIMAKALESLRSNESPTPAEIDTVLDKAMFADVIAECARYKSRELNKYWTANIDLTNIAILLRVKQKVGGGALLASSYISGGSLSLDMLTKLADASYDAIAERLRFTDYNKIVELGTNEYKNRFSLVGYEREWDNYLMSVFRSSRNDLFTIAPIAGFYIAKKIELKTIRMMLVCIKNGVDVAEIKQRLRDIYA